MKRKRASNVSLGDVAYQAIREAITSNTMKPGDRLSEYMVADWLKISRTPAREGLRRLESEGLLTSHPRRGLVVANLDESAVHELYAAREVLESTVAAMAARFATDAEISRLQHMVEIEAAMADRPELMFEHNLAFHKLVSQAARNRYLVKFLQSLADTISAHRSVSTLTSVDRRAEVLQEHRDLVDAISRHDEEAARAAALRHIQGALRARLSVQRQPVPEPDQAEA
ncbi:MAG TPA: GntR family transcriptional regulator [Ramlibacter sp.]|nr:GntR family transcriptional regulator [Ramlibacter sp.]